MIKDHSESEETRCRHMGYSFQLAARVLLYASSQRQDKTYHGLCYTSRGALAGTRNMACERIRAPTSNTLLFPIIMTRCVSPDDFVSSGSLK